MPFEYAELSTNGCRLEQVREKAVEIANAVLSRGEEEGRSIHAGNSVQFS
jgi:uncharacterized protein YdaT